MNSKELDLKAEIAELRAFVIGLEERIIELETREMNDGIYLDGVSEGNKKFIEFTKNKKGV